jgi:cytidine deaminase
MPTHNTGKPVFEEDVSYIEDFDPYSAIFDWAPSGLDRATGLMDSESRSYRIKVGTVVTNYNEDEGRIIGIGGANYKPAQKTKKECAELTAQSEAMKRLGRTFMPVLFEVVSSATPSQVEDIIGVPLPTLPPCVECRDTLLPEHAVVITQFVAKDRQKRTENNKIVEVHTGLEVIQIGDPRRFPVKTRAREVERVYPKRILRDPTPINFELAKELYLERSEAFSQRSGEASRMLRAQLAVTALADVME